jgi:hypothetical protein
MHSIPFVTCRYYEHNGRLLFTFAHYYHDTYYHDTYYHDTYYHDTYYHNQYYHDKSASKALLLNRDFRSTKLKSVFSEHFLQPPRYPEARGPSPKFEV